MAPPPTVIPRLGEPDTWYPAGVSGVAARWLTLPGGERVRLVEPSFAQGGQPVLLLHGWGCNAFHFRRLIPALQERGVRGIAVDLRGHGLSEKPNDAAAYSSAALRDFTGKVIDALGLESVGVIGHSLGAAIAIDAAAAIPNRITFLLLLNPLGLTRLLERPLLARLPIRFAERMPSALSRAVGFTALHMAYGRVTRPDRGDLEQYLFPTLLPGGRFGMLAYGPAFSWEPRTADTINSIRCPTRVMAGERDRVVKLRAVQQILRSTTVQLDVVAGAGHVLAEEVPEIVAEAAVELAGSA